jgi:high-affinity iron transporter
LQYANPELLGGAGWGVFRAILGWQNSATYGSVISYNVYWIVVIIGFLAMRYNEVKGHWPLMKPKSDAVIPADSKLHSHSDNSSETGSVGVAEKKVEGTTVAPIRSIEV